jgi:crotonobetainyl-CoA:carnitine CoA-transferase CaiB-like acyl-CoA transferase
MKTSDGYVRIAAPRGAHTDRLAKLMGVEEVDRENFKEWVSTKKRDELVELLSKNDLPVAPINHIPDTLKDPHLKARDAFVEVEDPRSPNGKLILPDFPVKLSKTPGKLTKRAPMLGEHNDEVLTTLLGYSKEEIEQLRNEKAIR